MSTSVETARGYRFCPRCGAPLGRRVLAERERLVCSACEFVFWQNPVVGVAVIVLEADRVLLGRRARGEYQGLWCIPCGYVEYDEHVRDAARREFLEETGLAVELGSVFTVHSNFHNPRMHSVGIWFRGTVVGGELRAADDLDAVAFRELSTSVEELAFPTDRLVLRQLREELKSA
ncbi:MAG: NUDIX hydrolase [Gammaproteobacteria bacterium]|nr:NUDIX hydrolase [Gammaproteobacteria bacterium]